MKNKNLKTVFTGLIIALAIILMTLTSFWADPSIFFQQNASTLSSQAFCLWVSNNGAGALNWKMAWIFFILLLCGIGFVVANFIMFTLPNKSKVAFTFDILTIVGFLMIFIGMFIPYGINLNMRVDQSLTAIHATQIFMYVGSPLALAMSCINGFVSNKNNKNEVPPQNTSIPSQPTNNI